MTRPEDTNQTPFHDLQQYVAIPRVGGLAINSDGTRLVTSVSTLNPKGTGYVSALWDVDPTGSRAAYRITRSAKGESNAAFASNGDLYFTSARPDPDATDDEDTAQSLWVSPAAGGEAHAVVTRAGAVNAVIAAKDAGVVVVTASVMPGAEDEPSDETIRKARKKADVAAILHDGYPVRYWDADLGPARPHLFAVETPDEQGSRPSTVDAPSGRKIRDLTNDIAAGLVNASPVISPDGTTILTNLAVPLARGDQRSVIARIDVATGDRTIVLDDDGYDLSPGPISPDGSKAVLVRESRSTPERAPRITLVVLDLATGVATDLASGWDRWASPKAWLPDGSGVLVVADQDGRAPVFRINVESGSVDQVTHDDAAYSDVVVGANGVAYGLRSSYAFPSEILQIDLTTGNVAQLHGPVTRPPLPGNLAEVGAQAPDGTRVRSWIALPPGASAESPAPLLLWIHGGPLGSWNAWSWRWNPWLMVAQGYAVLLPDPALSTGYGQDFVQRGWGRWGAEPFTDLMAATDAAVARPDIDADRTAAMGGSFGGYMANWVAGHTNRFKAIVTHASLWALDQFGPTTDASHYWSKEMTPQMAVDNSPHRFVKEIATPMLVVHGDKDYRVPIGEGLRLWYELLSQSQLATDEDGRTPHRFLYFPNENHWVLSPQHARIWYGVVHNFLATHIGLDVPELPAELGLIPPPSTTTDKPA
ncbi:dipeptidyl aminopeptidase/acylaminoacyl peptidase [Antricoccus suffuscus]|uniref:Dipeptidyl aminopeptidase/acylaminoacyl peptidase n=1 Tax=Antricoccus suffuscus TaxID=1629062 RepID=A0A2T1A2X1_9ACTN|nr:alpha/beta fold hydrolase [Antricoccus suffuscus]PRZ42827.1 dipeptidyl aminopeptidase/acylaminoacyl peptidase [Antricoccus suffuscus]